MACSFRIVIGCTIVMVSYRGHLSDSRTTRVIARVIAWRFSLAVGRLLLTSDHVFDVAIGAAVSWDAQRVANLSGPPANVKEV